MTQPSLFSGQQLKARGQARAAGKHSETLWRVQALAKGLGQCGHKVTIEMVRKRYEEWYGPWDLGNAAGSVFAGPEWECVGYKTATRPLAHARILRVWRLK